MRAKVLIDMTGWVMSEHGVPDSRWTILERDEDIISPNGSRIATYKCQCSCEKHTIKTMRGSSVRYGNSKSCGCLREERLHSEENKKLCKERAQKLKNTTGRVRPRRNIIGEKFGMLTAREQTEDFIAPNGQRFAQYICDCDCGNECIVLGGDLTRNETSDHKPKRHCGCQTTKNMSEAQRKYNQYDLSGAYGVGWATNTGMEFYFNLEDYDKIKEYCWHTAEDHTGYIRLVAKIRGTEKHIKMSHLLGFKDYDHINRNSLDNRKENFRQADSILNGRNRSVFSNNKSGYTGVYWEKSKERWIASIKVNKKDIYLGAFQNKNDAVKVRLEAEAKYFGEWAPQQHLFEEWNIKLTQQNDLKK